MPKNITDIATLHEYLFGDGLPDPSDMDGPALKKALQELFSLDAEGNVLPGSDTFLRDMAVLLSALEMEDVRTMLEGGTLAKLNEKTEKVFAGKTKLQIGAAALYAMYGFFLRACAARLDDATADWFENVFAGEEDSAAVVDTEIRDAAEVAPGK